MKGDMLIFLSSQTCDILASVKNNYWWNYLVPDLIWFACVTWTRLGTLHSPFFCRQTLRVGLLQTSLPPHVKRCIHVRSAVVYTSTRGFRVCWRRYFIIFYQILSSYDYRKQEYGVFRGWGAARSGVGRWKQWIIRQWGEVKLTLANVNTSNQRARLRKW